MTEDMVAVLDMRWRIEELQEVVSNAECSVIHCGGRADDHEPPRVDMEQGEVDDITFAVAALDLGTLETRAVPAVDAEEGDECPVCLETLVLNDPMRLPCTHLICNQCLQQLHRHGVNQLCPLCRAKLPCGCDTLYSEAVTLWTRADRGKGDRDSQFRQAVGLCQRVMELDSTHAGATGLLGRCYQDGLGLELCKRTALGLLEKAMKINEAVLGPHHPNTATSLNNLATLHHNMGNHKLTIRLFTRALEIREAVLGPRHPDTASSLNNLAMLHHKLRGTGLQRANDKRNESGLVEAVDAAAIADRARASLLAELELEELELEEVDAKTKKNKLDPKKKKKKK